MTNTSERATRGLPGWAMRGPLFTGWLLQGLVLQSLVLQSLVLTDSVMPSAALANPLPPPSAALLRSLRALERDIIRLDQGLPKPAGSSQTAQPNLPRVKSAQLPAPPAGSWPTAPGEVDIVAVLPISLVDALNLAVQNDPDLAAARSDVMEQRGWLRSMRGRLWPELSVRLRGGFSQQLNTNAVWTDNIGIYPANSPFLVQPGGRNRIQTNLGLGAAGLEMGWELINIGRNAGLAEAKQGLNAAGQRYANRLRQLQLDVSLVYYNLQLAQQLRRVRQVVLDSDTVVRDEVAALKRSGLVPRLDLLRAEADLQLSRYRLEQADALELSQQRQLSNLVNVPYGTTLQASEAVELQPPWPLTLQQTLIQGFRNNPRLLSLQATREALVQQANRRAAELLPSLRMFAQAGYGEAVSTKPVIDLQGCCASSNIPQLGSTSSDWAAGLELRWKLFDAGVTGGAVEANRAAAARTEQTLARERNHVRQTMETAFFEHSSALGQIVASRASYAAAREAFRDVRARYQLGLADYTDLSSTIRQLTGALEGVAASITLANVSYAQLLRELLPVPSQPEAPVSLPLSLPLSLVP